MPDARRTARLSPEAEADFIDILAWSRQEFGAVAASRYVELILQALTDLEANPVRPGAKQRPELPPGVMTYHLAGSRDRVAGQPVRSPRHFVLYRIREQTLDVLRFLHDARDLARHLPAHYRSDG